MGCRAGEPIMIDERTPHTREAQIRPNTTRTSDTSRSRGGRATGDDRAFSTRGIGRVAVDGGRRTGIDVLHIEPDPRAAELLTTFVAWAEEDVTIRSVDRVADALDHITDVGCVVTEQRLPDGSGIDIVARAREHGIRTPVLFHRDSRRKPTTLVVGGSRHSSTQTTLDGKVDSPHFNKYLSFER